MRGLILLVALLGCGRGRAPERVIVSVTMAGASPEVMDTELARPLARGLVGLPGVLAVSSRSVEGQTTLVVDVAKQASMAEIRDYVGRNRTLPQEAGVPVVRLAPSGETRLLRYTLDGPLAAEAMFEIDERVVRVQLERVAGVRQVWSCGARAPEITIWLDGERLMSTGVSTEQVRRALLTENLAVPAGYVDVGGQAVTIRTTRHDSLEDLERMTVGQGNGFTVRLGDVAHIARGLREPDCLVLHQGRQAVTGWIVVAPDGMKRVRQTLATLTLPPDLKLTITGGDAELPLSLATPAGTSFEQQLEIGARVGQLVRDAVVLVEKDELTVIAKGSPEQVRSALRALPSIGSVRSPTDELVLVLRGPDRSKLESAAETLVKELREDRRVAAAGLDPPTGGASEVTIEPSHKLMADLGISPADVASAIRLASGGEIISQLIDGAHLIDVRLRLGGPALDMERILRDVRLTTPQGALVPLGSIASVSQRSGPRVLATYNGEPSVAVWISAAPKVDVAKLKKDLAMRKIALPAGGRADLVEHGLGPRKQERPLP
jgi:multidrug efflux pump subunit AcrB